MAVEITMPQLSDTMDKGTIVAWFKKEGEKIGRGDALAEVATDKANLEIESFHEGILLQICTPEGAVVKVGEVIALVGEAGETLQPKPAPTHAATGPEVSLERITEPAGIQSLPPPSGQPFEPVGQPAPASGAGAQEERLKISPLARNLARTYGVDPAGVSPTGEGGRIVRRDIERAASSAAEHRESPLPAPTAEKVTASAPPLSAQRAPASEAQRMPKGGAVTPFSRMRQAIAVNMVASKTTIPHFYMTAKAEVDDLLQMKETLKQLPAYEPLTVGHLIIRAAVLALQAVPRVNSCCKDDSLVEYGAINIGIITALEDGLLIPVLHDAGSMPLADLAAEAKALVQRARAGRPKGDDLIGATFNISNVGPFNVESFSAIVFPGQGAVLAVSGIHEEAVAKAGQMYPAQVMRFTLSADHRVIDGVVAAQFLTELTKIIENPVLLLA